MLNKYIKNGVIELFHVSNPFFREKILKEGLVPQIGDSYKLHYQDIIQEDLKPRLFFCFENTYCSSYDDDRYKIILTESEFYELDFKIDTEVNNAIFTENKIDLKYIYMIYKGNVFKDRDWALNIDKEKLINIPLLEYK